MNVYTELRLGPITISDGLYRISGGSYTAVFTGEKVPTSVGLMGNGRFEQLDGSVSHDSLEVGCLAGAEGTYVLSGGTTDTYAGYVGYDGIGLFEHSAGTHTATYLDIGNGSGSDGTYDLSGTGHLAVGVTMRVGVSGLGLFLQSGGTNVVSSNLYLGRFSGSDGTYDISAGDLSTANFYVGDNDSGTLNITGSAASITVSSLLHFGPDSTFTAVPGSTIHMTGSAFENENTDPTDLAGLSNLELIFEGGSEDIDPFEVAGAIDGGFVDNFALGTLTLGGVDIGQIQLVDDYDNGNRGATGKECLFLHDIDINVGSTLDVYSHLLYVESNVESMLDSWIADGRLFDSTGYLDAVYFSADNWTAVVMPGDLNSDGIVDVGDINLVLGSWGLDVPPGNALADPTGDAFVDVNDLNAVLGNWAGHVPEPATMALLLAGGLALLNRRHKSS
ncbi:hypothetical protein ES705_28083 [subsurface metagenome]